MNMTNMNNGVKKLIFSLLVGGTVWCGGSAVAQDIINITSLQQNKTFTAAGDSVSITFRLAGRFALTNSNGGTSLSYPTVGVVVNGDIMPANWGSFSANNTSSGWKTDITFTYTVKPGDMASPLRLYGYSGSGSSSGDAYLFAWNGWGVWNLENGSNAVWQVNYAGAEPGFTLDGENLNFGSKNVTIRTLAFDEANSPTTVAATDTTTWHVTTVDSTLSAVPLHVFTTASNIVQVGTVSGQRDLGVTMATGTKDVSFSLRGLAIGSADIYVMRQQDYASVTNYSLPSSFTNYIKRTISVTAPPEPTVSVEMSATGTDQVQLDETSTLNAGKFTVKLSETFTNDVWVRMDTLPLGQRYVTFNTDPAPFYVRVPAGSLTSVEQNFNVPDGNVTSMWGVTVSPVVTNADALAYFKGTKTGTVKVQNVKPSVTASCTPSVTRGVPCTFSWTASDASATDMTSGMTISWNFNGEAITNITGASYSGTIDHIFNSTGTKTIRVTAKDKDGAVSDEYVFTVDVALPQPQPTVSVVPTAPEYNETTTNSTGALVVYLSESYSTDVYVQLDATVHGHAQSNIVFSLTEPVFIPQGYTNSQPLKFSIPDGTEESEMYGVRIVPTVTNAPANTYFTGLQSVTVFVKNVRPTVTKPVFRDTSLLPSSEYTNVPMGRPFSFAYTVKDVSADTGSMVVTWRFGDGTADLVVTGAVGSVSHTFTSLGPKYIWMQATDKDNGYSDEIEFPIMVVQPPPNPTVRILSPVGVLSETSTPRTGSFIVQLSESFTNDVTIGITLTPANSAANGTILISTNRLVFKPSDPLEKTIYISARDGTDISLLNGFQIIPTVLGNAAAANYYTELDPGYVLVMNLNPVITSPVSTAGTTNSAFTAAQGIPYSFPYNVTDVAEDLTASPIATAMKTIWVFGDGGVVTNYGGSGSVSHTYTSSGDMTVTMTAYDKDGGTASVQFKVTVKSSKEVLVTPIGPSQTSYYGVAGTGYGTVDSPEARHPVTMIGYDYDFLYNPDISNAKLIATPYTVATYDSFFYVWVGGEDLGLSDKQLSPYKAASLWSTNGNAVPSTTLIVLPDVATTTTSGTTGNGTVSAIFSREYLPTDNMGDINNDGIPDMIAFQMEQTADGGIDIGDVQPGVTKLHNFNGDIDKDKVAVGDYMPINPNGVGGTYDFRAVSDGTGNNDFTALLEVRGKHSALNMVIGGVNVSDVVDPQDEPHTDPMAADTDGDGLPDGWEYYFWYNAVFNGMTGSEYNPNNIAQGIEIDFRTVAEAFEPSAARAILDIFPTSIADSSRDFDKDGLMDREELVLGTNPINWDTDGDGICDTWEVMRATDPCSSDLDGNPDGDYMAYASVDRQFVKITLDGVTTNTFLAPAGTGAGAVGTETITTWYHYGSDADPIAVGYPVSLTGAIIVDSVPTNALVMHHQVMREFGFDPRTAWTSALNNEDHPTRWPAWLADAVNTKPFTTKDEYLLIKFMSENRLNGAGASMPSSVSVWSAYSTDPTTPNSDVDLTTKKTDGMPDGWELYVSMDPNADLMPASGPTMRISPWNYLDGDLDHPTGSTPPRDGLINRREFAGTDSSAEYADTGLYNKSNFVGEVSITRPASDALWLNKFWPSNPWAQDTDGDGLDDLAEMTFVYGTPVDNGTSCIQGGGLNPNAMDTDLDALPDAWEFEFKGTEPTGSATYTSMAITNGMDGTFSDYDQDWDADGLKNYQEYWVQSVRSFRYDVPAEGTTSQISGKVGLPMDTTSDPMALFTEVTNVWDRSHLPWDETGPELYVLLPLANVYGVTTKLNLYATTDPRLSDTDGDGMDDYYEMFHGLNPILGDLMERAAGNAVSLDADRIAKAYFNQSGAPIVIGPTIAYFKNDWDTGINLDFTQRPWMTGLPEVDPDADGLLNSEERLLPNTAAPSYSNTDPTPIWLTDTSNTNSVTVRFYGPGANSMFFWPPLPEVPPAYVYNFEMNEGYDTDNDGVSDKAELVGDKNSLSDPQDSDDPYRRQAMWFSGTNSAASSFQGFSYGVWTLRSFTVELWARPEVVTNREQVLIERVLAFMPSDLSNMDAASVVRRNFRVGIAADGRVYGMFENMGSHDEHTATVVASGDALKANEWVHLAIRMDGANSTFTLLVNGQVSAAVRANLIPATGTLIIQSDSGNPDTDGSYTLLSGAVVAGAANLNPKSLIRQTWDDYSLFYQGSLDEVRIWDGARSNDEIRNNYTKRFGRDDLLNNRLEVRTDELAGYSRVWTNPLQLPAELLFHYTFDNLFGADSTNGVATSPRGFEDAAAATNRPSYAAVGWWDAMATKSTVYTDYNYLPWIENGVEHLPVYTDANEIGSGSVLLTNGVADSVYWSYTKAGNTSGTYLFPNSNNPYGFRYPTTGNASDLLPLGDAFPKQLVEMWDGMGASGAWLETVADSDSDGLPDWWELYISGTTTGVDWGAFNSANSLTYGQQYQRDVAKGMTAANNPLTNASGWTTVDSNGDGIPDSSTPTDSNTVVAQTADSDHDGMPDWWETMYGLDSNDATGVDGADGDPDEDGLSNYYEYLAGTNPFSRDTDSDGTFDLDEDADHDGLSNGEEFIYGTNLADVDTDDDGLDDLCEVQNSLDPVDPIMPYMPRTLVNNGTGYLSIPKAPLVKGEAVDPDGLRFNLSDWTLSAQVKLTAVPTNDVLIIQRRVQSGTQVLVNYELGISKGTCVPYVRFNTALGTEYRVTGYKPIETNEWTQVGGRFGASVRDNYRQLSLIQDYTAISRLVSGIYCVTNIQVGDLMIASSLVGEIDEVQIWNEARSDAEIASLRNKTLLFGNIGQDYSYSYNGVTTNVTADVSARSMLLYSGKVVLYLPFDDGRHVGTNAVLDAAYKVHAVDDFVHYADGWQTGRPYAGTLVGGIEFSPLTNNPTPVFPLEVGSRASMDSDGDGMPDVFEVYYGLDPDNDGTSGSFDLGPDGDPDGDGLPNLYEYYAGTDPWFSDSNEDGISDADADSDGDGLKNGEEYRLGSHPGRTDTDDDGFADGMEVGNGTNPAFSDSPTGLLKSMRLDGTKAYQIPSPSVNRKRFNSAAWTIEAWVRPATATETGTLIKYAGTVYPNGTAQEVVFYELGLDGGVPYVRMDTEAEQPVVSRVNGGALPADEWSHVAGVFNPDNNALTLYLNGIAMASVQVIAEGLAGSVTADAFPGKAFIGSVGGVKGNIDEVRIWKQALTQDEVLNGIKHLVPAGDKRLICYFRFDDGGVTAEDFAYPIRPPRAFNTATVAWTGNLDTPLLYCLSGVMFDATTAYTGTRQEVDDYDGDGLPDWWEDFSGSRTVTYPVTGVVFHNETNTTVTVVNGVTNTATVIKRIETDLYVRDQISETLSPSSERAFSVLDLGWDIAYGTVTTIPWYYRASDGTWQGRWIQNPDAVWLLKDVYLTAEEVATAEMRFLFYQTDSNSVVCINGHKLALPDLSAQWVSTLMPAETDTYKNEIWENYTQYFLDAAFLKQGQYLKVGWNRIAVQQVNSDSSVVEHCKYEQFWLTLVANAGQKTLINQNDRWWVYGHPGSMVEPPVDAAGRVWSDPDYGLDTGADADGDGLPNYYEMLVGTNPNSADSDGDGVPDGEEDADGDGLQNILEFKMGTEPLLPDTDDDGVLDLADGYAGATGNWATNALLPKVERYLSLDGSGYLEAPLVSRWGSGTNSFTLRMSVKPYAWPVATTNLLAGREVYSGVYNYALRLLPGGKVEALVTIATGSGTNNNISVISTTALTVNEWTELALVVDFGHQRLLLLVNGVQSGIAYADLRQLPATSGAGLVHTRFGVGFNGALDDIAFYHDALSEAALTIIRTDGILAYPTDKLQACYLFDDGTSANGVSGKSSWKTGQVQDFAYLFWSQDDQTVAGFTCSDWKTGWSNAGSLIGTGATISNFYSSDETALLDQDGDGIPDWWELKYGMNPYSDEGENGAMGDLDGDGLSNYAEYLISEVYKFHPGLDPTLFSTTGTVSDYFLKQGALYYGEMFADHDFVEDAWEYEQYAPWPYVYNANSDDDEDGWSNWAECRYSIAEAAKSGTNAVWELTALDNTRYPIPMIEATFRYAGSQSGDSIVVQTYSSPDMNGAPDATFTCASTNTWPLTAYLKTADSGYVRGGTNYVFAFLDLSGNGAWDAGEPCGVATPFGNDIGWDYNRINVQLTDYTPGYLRMDLSGKRSEDVISGVGASGGGASAATSALETRVRVWRSYADGYSTIPYVRCVFDKIIKSSRIGLHEGDWLGQGEFGLDWGLPGLPTTMNRQRVGYAVYVGNNDLVTNNTLVAAFTNTFDVTTEERAIAVATSPVSGKYVYSACPTFKWIMPDRYIAFAIEIKKGSSNGTTIYQSGTVQAPVRDQVTGEFVWTAPIHAGDRLPNGQVFASNTLYAWRVIALNSKFTLTTDQITWSEWNYFKLDVNAPAASSGYGELRAAVKYYGPASKYLSGRIKVQAFRTASFTGVPDAQYTLSDTELGMMTNTAASGTNAVMRGLVPSVVASNYYVRAYVDSNTNGIRDVWESWGYANEYGVSDTPYTPKPFAVKVSTLPNVASINIEDADTDQDWLPDVWEFEQNQGVTNFLGASGSKTESNSTLIDTWIFSSLALTMMSDQDGDGVSDLVELITGSNPNSASTVNDGYTDTQKKSIGLLGSDALSFTVTRLDVKSADADLTWQVDVVKSGAVSSEARSVMGLSGSVTYAIEYTPSLLTTGWTTITTVGPVTLDGARTFKTTITTSDTIDLDKGFFRIRLLGN